MNKVTAISTGRGRRKRVNVFLDGKFAFSLEAEVAAREGLRVGQELTDSYIETLSRSDHYYRCLNAAAHYLDYRPRSEFELRQRLGRRGFDSDSIEAVITGLRDQGLVDDTAFARFWCDNRESFNPCSRWLTKLELKRMGVAGNIIDQVVDAVDEDSSAYRVALSKARRLAMSDYQDFRRRLGEYLKRRGFDYGIINRTVERIWQERGSANCLDTKAGK